ncbi:MAG TPA: type 4a pilus biogenesis protein PilO [Candidatus Paceibacterota bacterium]|nr:type 4a pilus biogenesis protein PilO [Candidatus Paceibacterota bacterium]
MNPSQKGIVIQISAALGIVCFLVLGVVLFGLNIKNSTAKIVTTREELALRTVSLQSLAALRADYTNKAKAYLNVLHNIVPKKDELIDLSKDFQAIASAGGLDYGFTFVGETAPSASELGSVKFNLKLGGDIMKLLTFLKDIQNFRYLVSVDSVLIFREESAMKMNVTGSVYFRQ